MEIPEILPCQKCGKRPTWAGSHGNTFGEPPYHMHHRCKLVCECYGDAMRLYPEIWFWNEVQTGEIRQGENGWEMIKK
jgi:hypothetical protein